jgi:Fur family transcriptional regulator, ferric uptake regulator
MNLRKLLQESNLSLTNQRIKLLSVLAGSGNAMTEKEIEEQLKGTCNKTTIYRNLSALVQKKIVHRILSDEAVRYRLVKNTNSDYYEHAHFQCRKCSTTFCMEEIPVQEYTLPEGFKMMENQLLILGICKDCRYEIEQNV